MSQMRRQAAEGIKAGQVFSVTRTFGQQDTASFGELTRDYNPVHYDRRFAASRGFESLICHGLLTGSMVCEVGGQVGWLATRMDFRFLKPVHFGDTVTCRLTVTEVDERGRARARAEFCNQRGEQVLRAGLEGVLPGPEQRQVLAEMLAEGDPTNPIK